MKHLDAKFNSFQCLHDANSFQYVVDFKSLVFCAWSTLWDWLPTPLRIESRIDTEHIFKIFIVYIKKIIDLLQTLSFKQNECMNHIYRLLEVIGLYFEFDSLELNQSVLEMHARLTDSNRFTNCGVKCRCTITCFITFDLLNYQVFFFLLTCSDNVAE